jgi:hypothetical protein
MECWGSKADDGLILFPAQCRLYKNRSHSAKLIIPTLQYSNTPWHLFAAKPIICDLARGPDFQCPNKVSLIKAGSTGIT